MLSRVGGLGVNQMINRVLWGVIVRLKSIGNTVLLFYVY